MVKEKSKEALASTNWNELLATNCNDLNISLRLLLKTVNAILGKYAPLTPIIQKMQKTHSKAWLTKGIWRQVTTKIKYTISSVNQKTQVGEIYYFTNLKSIGISVANLPKTNHEKYY